MPLLHLPVVGAPTSGTALILYRTPQLHRHAGLRHGIVPEPIPPNNSQAPWRRRGQKVAFNAVMSQNHRMKLKATGKTARTVDMGRFIVADPKVCHGKPTFKGTRVMVFQVLEQVAYGTPWERIVWSWRGKVPMEAITEAVRLASLLFQEEGTFQKGEWVG